VSFSKQLTLRVPGRLDQTVGVDGGHRVGGVIECDAAALEQATIVLSKGKVLNIITGEYQLSSLHKVANTSVQFTWIRERC
jgi:hypothetical protein